MPYDIKRNYGGCKGYAVVGGSGIHGCHTTRRSAVEQQRALYAAENAKKMQDIQEMYKSDNEEFDKWDNETQKCWVGYRQEGMKEKDGRMVPNCVPVSKSSEEDINKSWSIVEGHPDCEGFAVVGSHGDIKSCHADRKSAEQAISQHNQNESDGMSDGNDNDHNDDVSKKDYSDKERQSLARRDMALPDGSFPIVTVADLRNAIQSVGRASNYSKARNHIIRRAEALGRTDLLPEEWKPKSASKAFSIEKRDVSDIDLKPTESMASNARRGLELRDKFNRGGTAVGVARARDLANRRELSPETVARMYSFFSRHEVDKQGKDWNNSERPSNGKIAWLLWGGDSGYAWAKQKWSAIQNARASKNDETWKDSPFSFYK